MPAPPARIRSTSVPCGTSSSSICPALICRSASETTPGRAEKHVTSRPIWWLSASRCAVGTPGWPGPLQYTVSPVVPASRSATIRLDGNLCATPNPAIPIDAPSPMSATAAAAEPRILSTPLTEDQKPFYPERAVVSHPGPATLPQLPPCDPPRPTARHRPGQPRRLSPPTAPAIVCCVLVTAIDVTRRPADGVGVIPP